jgi:HD-GYP domain-containing protein (c-di-GMP phosphodiesterase class II)
VLRDLTGLLAAAGAAGVVRDWQGGRTVLAKDATVRAVLAEAFAHEDEPAGLLLREVPDAGGIGAASATVFVASKRCADTPWFCSACERAGEDAMEASQAFAQILPPSGEAGERLLAAASAAFDRALQLAESESTSEQLAESLAQSFERADVMLSLAGLARDLYEPDEMVRGACEQLRTALEFDFAGLVFHSREGLPRSLRIATPFAVSDSISERDAERAALAVLAASYDQTASSVGAFAPPFAPCAGVAMTEPLNVDGKPVGVLVAGMLDADLMAIDSYQLTLAETVCGFLGPTIDNLRLREAEQRSFLGTLEALSATLDAKDPYTRGHSERVAHLSVAIGEVLRLERADLDRLHIAGRLHDIGKIGIPENVLLKPGRLTDAEFAIVRKHPEIGHEILSDVPSLEPMLPAVLHHHERWDGRGYPHGLAAEGIPFDARIMAVADTFDAMSSRRSYRDGMPRQTVLAEIAKCAGSQFDPKIAHAFASVDLTEYDRLVAAAAARERELAQRRAA